MPIVKSERMILTKTLGVTRQTQDTNPQAILAQLKERPELADIIYLEGMNVRVLIGDDSYKIGYINAKYADHIYRHHTKLKTWKVTGGYTDPKTGENRKFGLNLEIFIGHARQGNRKR